MSTATHTAATGLELPLDRPRRAVPKPAVEVDRPVEAALLRALASLEKGWSEAVPEILLAGFQLLLHRYGGPDVLTVGLTLPGLQEAAGLAAVRNLSLRLTVSPGESFRALLERTRQAIDRAPASPASLGEPFQAAMTLGDAPLPPAEMVLSWRADATGARAVLHYDPDLFDATTAARTLAHLEALMQAAAAAPERPVGLLSFPGEAERQQVILEWNDTGDDAPAPDVHACFAAQAGLRPTAIAVEHAGERLTYGELAGRAARLARRLRSLGIGPDELVGVCLDRSQRLLEALLGVLEAGGAYLPLDPSYPPERLAFMLEDSRAALLLTERRFAAEPWMGAVRRVCLDEDDGGGHDAGTGPAAAPAASPDNLAYVLYTSGSTGRPKGVQVPRGALANFLLAMQTRPGLPEGGKLLAVTTLSFDIAALELFLPLLCGGCVVLASREEAADGARLARLLDRCGAAAMQATPTTWRLLLESGWRPRRLLRVLCGGEAFPADLAERLLPLAESVWNLYGPTETTVWSCVARVESAARPLPIGRPVRNTRVLVLDRDGNPSPTGMPGELCIAGAGLARGYLGRPELTAERFVPDPSSACGERLYRTGDLVRLRADGALDYLGRIDQQVKLRGFRIELGEIEAELARHPAVQAAVAGVLEGDALRLVAWYVPAGPGEVSAGELREHLARRLPEAMVPSAFVPVAALPLTPNGKVDRRALPAPGRERPELPQPYVEPHGALETRLARLWAEVLDLEQVGAQDGFFELGGDSVRGALALNRLQRELGEPLYVMSLFDAPSPAAYAGYLRRHYATAVLQCFPTDVAAVGALPEEQPGTASAEVAEMQMALAQRHASATASAPAPRIPPALFILSPPRAGSTLLRVMLAGHPRLFSPPELHLLGWETLTERAAALSGRESFAAEGLMRAVMELEGCGSAGALERVRELEARGATTRDAYLCLQQRAGGRMLVDKTPTYGFEPQALHRAERIFEGAFYLHLVRHPIASVHSYVEARMDRVYGLPFAPERQAELVWSISHQNISEFLAGAPRERWLRLRFEDLVRAPEAAMREVCRMLGIDFDPSMLRPYEGERMTDGLHGVSRMMGDPRFREHREIQAAVAERWRDVPGPALDEETWRSAEALGYQREPRLAGLQPVSRRGPLPLSFAQERLWFLDRLQPGSAAYNVPLDLRLSGTFDRTALAAALTEIARRHETLRSSFPGAAGRPVLAVAVMPPAPLDPPCIDLAGLPPEVRASEAPRLARNEGRRPFDLEVGPLMRATLLRLDVREHRLLLTLHHAVCDGWSRVLLLEELAALYPACAAGLPSPLPELPVQYVDYAIWQRQRMSGARLERELRHWRKRLAGAPALELPSDRPRPAVYSFRGLRRPVSFSAASLAAMKDHARAEGVTLFMLLAAAFFSLLRRYTGQGEVLVGAAVAGRNQVELERLIGFFANTVVLRARMEEGLSFRLWLRRVREITLEAYAYQEVPFEKLVEELQPDRDLSRNPLFQAALTLHGAPLPRLGLPGLTVEPLDVDTGTAKVDLSLQLTEVRDRLTGFLELSADLFDAGTAARLEVHLGTMLAAAVDRPDTPVGELPLLSAGERHQVLLEWAGTAAAVAGPPVHRQLESRAESAPGALAMAGQGGELSYGVLRRSARQLARHLRSRGVGPEVVVAVCADRSPALVVAALGILEAGGAYLPLDPASPPERLAWLLESSGARVVVTRERFLPALPASADVVCLDRDRAALALLQEGDLEVEVDGTNLAYVIYTSGSTGWPKGVAVSHETLANLVDWHRRAYGLTAADRVSLVAAPGFDASVWEIWPCLASGASLHVPDDETAGSPAALKAWLGREAITVAFLPTPLAEAALAEPWPAGTRLRALLTGGDRLQHGPREGQQFALFNHYGPTENTVVATCCAVAPGEAAPPIGRPIDGVRIHLLGSGLQPLPAGVPGELCLGGGGLARCYLGRPDLTAASFVPDPFSPEPGSRMYRTGDLVRFRREGSLEFLGRFDQQVKIRGFRIELGEVEAVLGQHPGVAQAVLAVFGERPEDRRLVAYVVAPCGGEAAMPHELRAHAAARLPAYMVPSAVMVLDALPLTAQGKVDRRALPPPPDGRVETEAVPPRNEVEEVVAGIWSELLGAGPVGVHHNFFALGGHSLKATQVISRLRGIFRVELPARFLFEEPTVAGLSGRLLADPRTRARVERAAQLWLRLANLAEEQMGLVPQGEESLS
ncbi:MAG TPA: amino acid adenylation domain-containing protein [Thermoanaerobaculia bacterium]|nr:amino acid adenylation domain-containing protein [Thermoanaerobaculia bacterium]